MSASYYPGRYWGKVIAQALGRSKEKQTPQFVLQFQIVGKVDPANPDGELIACDQLERSVYLYITDKTIEYVTRDLERLGFAGSSFSELDPGTPNYHDFTGTECGLLCEHETYNDKVQERWSIARGSGGLQCEPMDAKKVRELDSLFGKNLKAIKKDAGPKRTVTPHINQELAEARVGPPPSDDEIPFSLLWLAGLVTTFASMGIA